MCIRFGRSLRSANQLPAAGGWNKILVNWSRQRSPEISSNQKANFRQRFANVPAPSSLSFDFALFAQVWRSFRRIRGERAGNEQGKSATGSRYFRVLRVEDAGEAAGSGKVLPRPPQFLSAGSLNESYEDESGLVRRGCASVAQREKKNGEREKRGESELNSHRPRRIHLQATLWPYTGRWIDLGQIMLLLVRVHGIARSGKMIDGLRLFLPFSSFRGV